MILLYIENILAWIGYIGFILGAIGIINHIITNKKINMKKAIEDNSNTEYITKTIMQTSINVDAFTESNNTIIDEGSTELDDVTLSNTNQDFEYLHSVVFQNRYIIDREMGGGGMSHVYSARSTSLGSEWLIKHIEPEYQALLREEDILKKLNHTNLPKIVDVFYDATGTYIVQSFIDGISMDKVIASDLVLAQYQIHDWAKQLAEVLDYLHTLKPSPIIHRDLKPANIIVSHSDKLVLIDFGISKEESAKQEIHAVSKHYASPEQSKKQKTDFRSDIYSFGVIFFELATKKKPNRTNHILLKETISQEFGHIILKCLKENPDERYQSSKDLLTDLERIQSLRIRFAQALVKRKFILMMSIILVSASVVSIFAAEHLKEKQKFSYIELSPGLLKISEQQSKELVISQEFENGEIKRISVKDIEWLHEDNNIARIDGDLIIGMNEGKVKFEGRYRDKIISTEIEVVKAVDGMVEISLNYDPAYQVKTEYGNGVRNHKDGLDPSFVSPESLIQTNDGKIFVVDGGFLRQIYKDEVSTLFLEPYHIIPDLIRTFDNQIYMSTRSWTEVNGQNRVGLAKVNLEEEKIELLYSMNPLYMDILDFTFDNQGNIFVIIKNLMLETVEIHKIDYETSDISILTYAYPDTVAIAVDNKNVIHISNATKGTIEKFVDNTWIYVAGIENSKNFIDGAVSQFYRPQKLVFYGEDLYLIDYNVVRKIDIHNDVVLDVLTLAGTVSTDPNAQTLDGRASDIIFDDSVLREIIVNDEYILISDPSNSVIRKIYK
ncbi:MAG: hypothetical protein ATN31_01635 [Candidatus Epulonipiscioides saccharophilum]|nr:MAG: hypothetical protein ATN31_01635 [Epulopiscium sp. AS2M-Bin001]